MSYESRLYSFLNQEKHALVHFLDGEETLRHIHSLYGFSEDYSQDIYYFYKSIILGLEVMINFLKPGEGFGVYIDCENPYFRFKIETNDSGRYRTLLMPHTLNNIPPRITGICRFTKITPRNKSPYTSVLQFEQKNLSEILDTIIKDSFQFEASLTIDPNSSQAMIIHRLPDSKMDKTPSLHQLNTQCINAFNILKNTPDKNHITIEKVFNQQNFSFIGSKKIHFECNCSRERMATGVLSLVRTNGIDDILRDEKTLEVVCDYCLEKYLFSIDEINAMLKATN